MPRLLLVSGSSADRWQIIHILQHDFPDLQVESVLNAAEFERAIAVGAFEIVLADAHQQWTDGLTLLKELKSHYPDCPVLMMTDSDTPDVAIVALNAGADEVLVKSPRQFSQFPTVIRATLKQMQLLSERQQVETQLRQLNTQLKNQVQQHTQQLQQAFEFEATLRRITDKVRDSFNEDYILQTVVEELAQTLGVNNCNAALYNLEQETATIQYESTAHGAIMQPQEVPMAAFPDGYQQLLQGQCFQWCNLIPHPDRGQMAILSCPIVDDQQVLGDLWLNHHSQHHFSEWDIRLLKQVANYCAIALRQARLYQTAQNQVQELERLNQLKDDFLSTVSHELRTPIANMKMAIQMLKLTPLPEKSQRYLEILQTQCDREADLVSDLLDLQRLEAAAYPFSLGDAVKLHIWLPEVIEPFQIRASKQQQVLQLVMQPDLPPLQIDHGSLKRLLSELLNNACKYTPAGGSIILRVACEPRSSQKTSLHPAIVFQLRNQAEIPPTELPHIFEKFYRVPNADPWKQGGTGLGLALVQKLVEQLQGTIQVTSQDGWTTFTLKFHYT